VVTSGPDSGTYGGFDTSWSAKAGGRPTAMAGTPSKLVAPPRKKNWMMFTAIGTAVVVLVVALVIVASSGTSPSHPAATHTTTTHKAPPPNPNTAPANAVAIAQGIGLQPQDFSGFAFASTSGGQVVTAHPAPSACTPLDNQPWWASVYSPLYSNNANSAISLVELLPTPADAQADLAAVTATQFGTACVQPQGDRFANAIAANVNKTGSCGLALNGSSVTPLSAANAWPGAAGFRYIASLSCPTQQSGVTADFVDEAVGNVFIEGKFVLFGGPQSGLEQTVMNAMAARAQAYAANH
jgi:hypothetical protein